MNYQSHGQVFKYLCPWQDTDASTSFTIRFSKPRLGPGQLSRLECIFFTSPLIRFHCNAFPRNCSSPLDYAKRPSATPKVMPGFSASICGQDLEGHTERGWGSWGWNVVLVPRRPLLDYIARLVNRYIGHFNIFKIPNDKQLNNMLFVLLALCERRHSFQRWRCSRSLQNNICDVCTITRSRSLQLSITVL